MRITNETEYSVTPNIQSSGLSRRVVLPRLGGMAKLGPHRGQTKTPPRQWAKNHVKQWRIFRELTVEQLAEATGLSTGNISGIENLKQGYSDESLGKIARALKTTPGMLLEVDPLADGADSFWPLWEKASPADRETLTIMANRLVEMKGRK